ncbi:hypothetical protein MAPG_11472 [Magnaporthiopsis poae ATCC 64411]|uniref:lytic cellulose monooxygenase (C4-dehydrogenating) n=1 Tax=Magnaporthiopsis poae (strain ATCC 64411 / 73-15) TaxID=644358 RepID=A0A0C4EFC9_MAGP6|nr:hypothetical protein MAPG_11472 [Magnaporthiopsis poae ATCC 64411]
MRCNTLATILAAAGVLPTALAHYNFESLVVNGKTTGPYEYVRRTTNSNSPIQDVRSEHMVCNQGGLDANIMAATKTYTVAPGDEFYIGCAQLKVTGSGTGKPGPTVKFPGAYNGSEPGILINIYWPPPQSYVAPGPATWPNACEDHTPNLVGRSSDGDCTLQRTRRSAHY